MAVQLDYAIKGSPRAKAAINEFLGNLDNFEKFGPKLHRYLRKIAIKTFKTEGREIGESWPDYTGSERVYGFIKAKLLDTDRHDRKLRWAPGNERLFPSVVAARHRDHVWDVKDGNFTFGTSVPYASKHQEGKGRGPVWALFPRIQQRRFLGLSKKHVAEIRRMIARLVGI